MILQKKYNLNKDYIKILNIICVNIIYLIYINLFSINDFNTKSNYSNNNNDFTRISNDKRKKLSLNISQLKSFNKEKYYITNIIIFVIGIFYLEYI